MSAIIEIRDNFVIDTDDLTGNAWTKDDSAYLTIDKMRVTNKSGDGITEIGASGVIGKVIEVPDLDNLPSRMVLDITDAGDDLQSAVKRLLQSRDL